MLRCALPIALLLLAGCGPTAEQQAADVFAEARFLHEEDELIVATFRSKVRLYVEDSFHIASTQS
jgi:hypothetical protein